MDRAFVLGLLRDWGLALVVAVAIFVGWSWLFGGGPVATGDAPDFALHDLSGEQVVLSGLQGQPVVLNFWATWCGPCKAEIPELNAFAEANSGVALLGISTDDGISPAKLKAFADRMKMAYPVLHDLSGEVARDWGVMKLPTTFVVSADGHITTHKVGMISEDSLSAMVAAARDHTH
jgi:peroxiredoxin